MAAGPRSAMLETQARPRTEEGTGDRALKRYDFTSNRHLASGLWWRMIFSDLPSPAEASGHTTGLCKGFAQAGNRYALFGIML
jgi:hypothetical protein